MARNRPLRVGFALALLLIASLSVVSSEDKCKSGCQGPSQIFKYLQGTTYKYNLESSADVSLASAEGQLTSTKLRGTVLVTALPQCDFLLRLQNVQVIGPDGKKYSNIPGIEKAVRFNFNDGRVDPSICAEHGDNQNSLNIKRAAISLFQAAHKQHYETDVFGECPTNIQTKQEGANLVIHKSRYLNKCAYRENVKQDLLTTAFNLNSDIKSSPFLSGEYSSEQRIKNGILDHAAVTENYLYVPFSIGKNGAETCVTTKIQYVGTSKDAVSPKCSEPRSIIFESPHLVNTEVSNVDAISAALKDTKNSIGLTVGEHTARSFINLIKILRVSKKDDILTVYGQVRAGAGFTDKNGAKKVLLDALFRAGTGDTVEVSIELLKNKELSPVEQKLVYLSLAFVTHATLPSLTTAASLLDQPNLPREAYLGIGIIAGRYCRQHSCKNVEAIDILSQKLLSKLGDGKAINRKVENEIISVLKAFGNFENLNDVVIPKIIQIAQDKKAPNRLRVAALDTYLAHACVDKFRDSALGILKDIQQDSEIRIKAYLVVAQCPNAKCASAIKALLDTEPSYQVGGFITSHLRNLKASASPEKANAKYYLGQISTTKHFPIDLRKYSFNNEVSYAVSSVGVASTVETNVIYSYNSFLPQSLNLNVTFDLFGHSINAIDLGLRQENLHRVAERYFGPLSEFSDMSSDEFLKSGKDSIEKIVKHFNDRLAKTKEKRDVSKADIDAINKQVQIKTNELNKDVDLDLSLKAFGSEILFLSVNDDSEKFTIDSLIDKIFDEIDNGISTAKDFDYICQSNMLFIDSEFSYPTSAGFALRLGVEGSSSVQIKAASKVDFKGLAKYASPIKFTLIPSVNVEIRGSLVIDAQVLENGLTVASTLYSATGGDIDIHFTGEGNGVDIKFSLPVEDQKLISATHEIVFNTRELGKPEVNVPLKFGQNKDFNICLDQVQSTLGITVCIDINSPPTGKSDSLPFPLSGNGKFAVSVHREDLSHFHFSRTLRNEQNDFGVDVCLEAIGVKQDTKMKLKFEFSIQPELCAKASFTSAIKTASFEGRIVNNEQEKSVALTLQHDAQKIVGKAGLAVSGGGSKTTYKPILQYDDSGKQEKGSPIKVDGAVTVEYNKDSAKYILDDICITTSDNKKITIKGSVGSESGALFSDISVTCDKDSASLNGKFQFYPDTKIYAEFKNSIKPHLNAKLDYSYKRQSHQVDTNLIFIHGPDLNSKDNRITASTCFMYKRKGQFGFEGKTEAKFAYPLLGIDTKFLHEVYPKHIKLEFEMCVSELKLGSILDFSFDQKTSGDYVLGFEVYGKNNKIRLDATREISGEKSQVTNCLNINGKKIEVNGAITVHSKPDDINFGADLVVKLPGRPEPLKIQKGFILNPDEFDINLKITSASECYVDLIFKSNKDRSANGSIKITLKDIITSSGQVTVKDGVGNGFIIFELAQIKRKLKAETSFSINEPIFKADLSLYFNYEKDNNYKWYFSTDTNAKENFIDSKNVAEFCGRKFEFNFKTEGKCKMYDSKYVSEFELILPSNECIVLKTNHDLQKSNDIIRGNVFASLEKRDHKTKPGYKFVFKGDFKSLDIRNNLYDFNYSIVGDCPDGNLLNLDFTAKRQKHDDHISYDENLKLTSVLQSAPLEISHTQIQKEYEGSFTLKIKCKSNIVIQGKYDNDHSDKKISAEITGDIDFSYKSLKIIKFSVFGLREQPQDNEYHSNAVISLFVDDDGTKPDATIDYKLQVDSIVKPDSNRLKAVLNVGKEEPVSLDYGFSIKNENGVNKVYVDSVVQYAKDKVIKADACAYQTTPNEFNLDASFDSPYAPNNKIQIYSKKSPDNQNFNGDITVITDKRKFVLNSELVLAETSPGFSVKFIYPDGKTDIVAVKVNKVTPTHYNGEVKIALTDYHCLFDNTFDAQLDSLDNFHIKIAINAPALKLDNFSLDAQNIPTKTGKRIQIIARCSGQTILAGSTNYNAREEAGKYIVEGSGSFKLNQETKQGNFKFCSQKYTEAKHGEEGFEVTFNAGVGSSAIDAEIKATNKQFRFLNSYCEEKQQCANIEIDSKLNSISSTGLNHELELAVDLRKLGLAYEFGLKAQTDRKEFALDHTVDVYFQSKENKYQYSVNVHPKDASLTLTTPKRIICFEAYVRTILQDNGAGTVNGEVALYLNKKTKPNEKTAITFVFETSPPVKKQSHFDNYSAVFKFITPTLGRDLSITYVAKYDPQELKTDIACTIDIFPDPSHKIYVTAKEAAKFPGSKAFTSSAFAQIKSDGLKFDIKAEENTFYDPYQSQLKYKYSSNYNLYGTAFDSVLSAEFDKSNAKIYSKILNKEILNINSHVQESEPYVATTDIVLLGVEPSTVQVDLKPYCAKVLAWRTATPQKKIIYSANLNMDKNANLPIDISTIFKVVKGSEETEMYKWVLHLDPDHFLQVDYYLNSDKIKENLIIPAQNDYKLFFNELKTCLNNSLHDVNVQTEKVVDELEKNLPQLKPLKEYYQKELEAIHDELISDKTINEISDFVKNVLGVVIHAVSDVFGHCGYVIEKVTETLQKQIACILELINKEIAPEFTEAFRKLAKAACEISEKLTDLFFNIIASFDSFCQSHDGELQQLARIVGGLWQDVYHLIYGVVNDVQVVFAKELENVYNGLKKSSAILEEYKARYQKYVTETGIPDLLLNTFVEICNTVKDAIPIDEVKRFIDAFAEYVKKKCKNERVDDVNSIENLITLAAHAFSKITETFTVTAKEQLHLPDRHVPPFSLERWFGIPKLSGIQFSPISYFANNDFTSLLDAIYGFSLNPYHWFIPYEFDALIIQGQHIFTFDGKHITFPGNCNYLLARDAYKGRFSIVGTYTSGILTEITFSDKTDIITIKKGGQVFLNNAPCEYPVRRSLTDAYRLYESVNIASKTGVRITCGPELVACGIHVSGYYHGDLRGLLGNANTEPFDDLTLPNGKIVQSEGDFCNSYQVGASCPPIVPVDHNVHKPNPVCSKWFGGESPFRTCYKFVNPANFRQACEHGLAAGVPDTEQSIVIGYIAACRTNNIPINIPKEFVKCTNGEQPFSLGDTFSVKIPRKAADIILVVDQAKSNELVFKEFVQPLTLQLTTELSGRGITDVQYHVIGYGGAYPKWLSHYTIDGKLTCQSAHLPTVQFSETPKSLFIPTGCEFLDAAQRFFQIIKHEIDLVTFQTPASKAYVEAAQYHFRPHAVKAIIGISSAPCDSGLGLLRLHTLFSANNQYHTALFLPFNNFNTRDPKITKNVIGFNANGVYTFTDARKKPEGDTELLKELEYDDICVDAVLRNHGTVFVANNFVQSKPPQKKQFAFVAARSIFNELVNYEQGLDCECSLVTPYTALNTCRSVFFREKEPVETVSKKDGYKG